MMPLSIELVFEYMARSPEEIWSALTGSERPCFAATEECVLDGTRCSASSVIQRLREQTEPHFGVHLSGGEIQYAQVARFDHALLLLDGLVLDVPDADEWVAPFIPMGGFVQAWVYDRDYSKWQNASDPLIYKSSGRSLEGLPMVSNGLPFPLEKKVVDISRNPGRRVLKQGYVEAVGGTMWLGQNFLESRQLHGPLASADWLQVEVLPSRAARLQTDFSVFSTDHGAQGEVQEDLRRLIYSQGDDA